MANEVRLQSEEGLHPVDENLRPLKIGDKNSSLELAQSGARITGDLELGGDLKVKGEITGKTDITIVDDINCDDINCDAIQAGGDITSPNGINIITVAGDIKLDAEDDIELIADGGNILFSVSSFDLAELIYVDAITDSTEFFLYYPVSTDDYCKIRVTGNGATTITTNDDDGTLAHLKLEANGNFSVDADGDITLDAAGGDVNILQAHLRMPVDKKITFGNLGEYIVGDDTDLSIVSSNDATIDAGGTIILDSADGNISLLDDGSTYTPSVASDATTKTYVDSHTVINNTTYARANNTTWYLFAGDQTAVLGGTDTSVSDTETIILSRNTLDALWFIVPYNMTIHAISGSVSDDDMSAHTDKYIGIWTIDSLSTSGNDPGDVGGSQAFTLRYITAAFGGTVAYAQAFHDTGADFALTAGQGVFLGYRNAHSGGLDDVTLNCTIWAHQTTP